MCRVLAYLGRPTSLENLLYATDASLARQAYSPRMMADVVNLAGFGVAAWDDVSARREEPFVYRTTMLPAFDENLRMLARKLEPTCVVAHVRGVADEARAIISPQNLHPFRLEGAGVAFAHNGHLREFGRMRYDLLDQVRPELARRVKGATDSEWLYVLLLSQLDDPFATPDADELADAIVRTLEVVRDVRARHGIDTASPANLFATTGAALVATRFSYDHGWYPEGHDPMLDLDLAYVTLWYTIDAHADARGDDPTSLTVASEPITPDISRWLEVPAYSLLTAMRANGRLTMEVRDLDL